MPVCISTLVKETAGLSVKNHRRSRGSDDEALSRLLDGKTGRKKRGLLTKIAGPLVIICAILAVLVAADHWINSGKIYGGVEVGTVQLGGKTPAEAKAADTRTHHGRPEKVRVLRAERREYLHGR